MSVEYQVREEVWRWRQGVLARAVRSRMVSFIPLPGLKHLGGSVVKLKWRKRPEGLQFLRIFTGRLYRSVVGVPEGGTGLTRANPETIHEVYFRRVPFVGPLLKEVRVGSRVPYAARHEFRPRGWEPYFRPSLEETADDLKQRVGSIYKGWVAQLVQRMARTKIKAVLGNEGA